MEIAAVEMVFAEDCEGLEDVQQGVLLCDFGFVDDDGDLEVLGRAQALEETDFYVGVFDEVFYGQGAEVLLAALAFELAQAGTNVLDFTQG